MNRSITFKSYMMVLIIKILNILFTAPFKYTHFLACSDSIQELKIVMYWNAHPGKLFVLVDLLNYS